MKNAGNLTEPIGISTERLFYAPAFVIGFGDGGQGRPFHYPNVRGPNPHMRSAQLAYERGRQFGVLWRGKPSTNLSEMKAALQEFGPKGQGIIT